MEPSETKVAPEIAGAMSFKITVPGKSVHACVKDEGISAIEKFILVYNGLMELEQERNKRFTDPLYSRYTAPYAISIGTVKGGEWPGTVAEGVEFEGRIGVAVLNLGSISRTDSLHPEINKAKSSNAKILYRIMGFL